MNPGGHSGADTGLGNPGGHSGLHGTTRDGTTYFFVCIMFIILDVI